MLYAISFRYIINTCKGQDVRRKCWQGFGEEKFEMGKILKTIGIELIWHDLRHLVGEDILIRGNLSSLMKALPLSPISSWTEPLLEEQKTRVREYLRSAKRKVS